MAFCFFQLIIFTPLFVIFFVIVHQTSCDNKNWCTLSELGLNQRAAEPNINYAIAVKGQLSTPHYRLKMADLCLASLPLITTAGKTITRLSAPKYL